jgi:hypothetical protein
LSGFRHFPWNVLVHALLTYLIYVIFSYFRVHKHFMIESNLFHVGAILVMLAILKAFAKYMLIMKHNYITANAKAYENLWTASNRPYTFQYLNIPPGGSVGVAVCVNDFGILHCTLSYLAGQGYRCIL